MLQRCTCIGILERDHQLRLAWRVIVVDDACPFPHEPGDRSR